MCIDHGYTPCEEFHFDCCGGVPQGLMRTMMVSGHSLAGDAYTKGK